jgi:hypothetical protein
MKGLNMSLVPTESFHFLDHLGKPIGPYREALSREDIGNSGNLHSSGLRFSSVYNKEEV